VFEVISEIVACNFGEQVEWRRFAWQAPEAQGSDLSGNFYIHVTREVRSEQHDHPIRQATLRADINDETRLTNNEGLRKLE
jgi:hypothetical protein